MSNKLYRIIRLGNRGSHAIGYAETGPSERAALRKLLDSKARFEGTDRPVEDGHYLVAEREFTVTGDETADAGACEAGRIGGICRWGRSLSANFVR